MERLGMGAGQLMASAPPPPPGFVPDAPPPPASPSRRGMFAGKPARPSALFPTGAVHDGDTFRLNTGDNARLLGVDAFELKQPGWDLSGNSVPLGQNARTQLSGLLSSGATIFDTGARTYNRPVVTATAGGQDAGRDLVLSGNAIPMPQYLSADPTRRQDYIDAQRQAIGDERGAYAGTYQLPSDYRHQGVAAPKRGKIAMTPQQAGEYDALIRNPKTTPEQLEAWAKAQGQVITNAGNILSFVRRNPNARASAYFQQPDVTGQAVLPNTHGGVERHMGAFNEGLADVVGFPVDIVNTGLSLTGLPMSDRPVMGSEWIRDRMHGLGIGQYDEGFAPRSDVERYSQAFARGTGQAVLPIGGTMAVGTRIGAAALPSFLEGGTVRQAFRNATREAAANPRVLIAGEMGSGVGSNVAGQAADDYAPGNPYAQVGAQILGGLAGGIGAGSLASARRPVVPEMRAPADIPTSVEPHQPPPGFVMDQPASVVAMSNEAVDPVLRGPAVPDDRIPDRIDVAGSRPSPLDQGLSEAQLRASSEGMEPQDVLPMTRQEESAASVDADGQPDLAGNIRLDKLDTPQDIQRALTVTDARVGGFDPARRGVMSQEETQRLANDLGMTPETLLSRRRGQAFNAEEALAARQLLAKSGNELVNLARRVQGMEHPGEEALAAFRQAWLRHVAIQEQVSGATAEAGRALAQFRMAANSRNVPGNVLNALVEGGGGVDRLKDAARIIVDGSGDPATLNQIAAHAMKPKFSDKLVELWYNSLLSGPQTHVVNMVSNTMTSLGQLPEHAIAAGIGGVRNLASRQAVNDRVLFTELGARSVGLLQGLKEGLVEGVRTMRTGGSSDMMSKVEGDAQHAISGIKGSIIRTPTRALAAEDEIFKAMARRMELSGLAVRQAKAEGLKGQAAQQRVADLIANPTDDMLEKAFDYGRYLTFQRPLGPVMRHLSALTQTAPVLKLVLPFVKTPTNLLKFTLERSPAAPVLKEWRADVKAGGARRDLALARAAVGSAFGAMAMEWANQGLITGGGPADDGAKDLMRADGWQPYSVKIGDRYYSYQRLDPLAMTMGIAADMVAMQEYMTDKQREQVAFLLTTATLKNMSEKTWFSGVSDLALAVSDPQRYGASLVRKTMSSMAVPAGVAQVARTVDPTLREAETIMEAVRARIPVASRSLEPRRDAWGQPITNEGGLGPDIMSPVWTSTRRNDPVNSALLDAGAHVGRASREVGGRRLPLSEYGRYQEAAGMLGYGQLNDLVGLPDWARLSRDEKQDTVAKIMRDARKDARGMLFNDASAPPPPPGFSIDPPPAGYVLDR